MILGVLLARNEWPLLGLCITHALTNHVDELLVIDHSSTDETPVALASLKMFWGEKLKVAKLASGTLHLEELNLLTLNIVNRDKYSWSYHVDADEFLFVSGGKSLKSVLSSVPHTYSTVRYSLLNFVAPSDFNRKDLDRYQEIVYRAQIDKFGSQSRKQAIDSMSKFKSTFFDMPFTPKVIYRSDSKFWARAGTHTFVESHTDYPLDQDVIFAAHLPFVSFDQLIRRADHGKEVRDAGYAPSFAWQSQMIQSFRESGQLERFWNAHSVNQSPLQDIDTAHPTVVIDERLSKILIAAVKNLKISLAQENSKSEENPYVDIESVTLSTAMDLVHQMKDYKDLMISRCNLEIRNLKMESARLRKEADAANTRYAKMQLSLSWRITKPARMLIRFLSRIFRIG